MNKLGKVHLTITLGAVMALAACQGEVPFAAKPAPVDPSVQVASNDVAGGVISQGGERDVQAPEIFQLTDKALWDGRPSLGGVWVAHASVNDPERVLIRNPANGQTVVGALFRREFDNPGPSLQLSSDAAEALGMLAGQPGTVEVIALKRIEAPVAAPEPTAPTAIADKAGTDDKTVAAAGQAVGTPTIKPAAKPAMAAATDSATLAANAAAAIDKAQGIASPATASAEVTQPPHKETWKERRARRKAEREAARAAKAGNAPDTGIATAAPAPAPAATATAAAANASKATASTVTASEITPAPAAQPAPSGETLLRPYIQIGIFSNQANAAKAKAQMAKAGMTATIKPDQSNGKDFWRVIVGPVVSVAERDALTMKVKAIGYPDAYPVKK